MRYRIFTSESVTEGHPDKLCDQIADSVLDHILERDPYARVACEVMAMRGAVIVTGEITANCVVDYAQIARDTIRDTGYNNPAYGFDAQSCAIFVNVQRQSEDIALGVDNSTEAQAGVTDNNSRLGAGDQGMMFGYACEETPELMPAAIYLSHKLCRRMASMRKEGVLPWMRPDGKSQVTVQYNEEGAVERCRAIVLSTQHDPDISIRELRDAVMEKVILPVIPSDYIDRDTQIWINPTGRFVTGGPAGDTGLTGRKIMVDTYGGAATHGGGSFSGKDSTKVDRSGAYMARYIAKNLVAGGFASKCLVSLAYAIGVALPVSVAVDTMGTGIVPDDTLGEYVNRMFNLRAGSIIENLQLRRPIYRQVASYGHFGRDDLNLPWEQTDVAELFGKVLSSQYNHCTADEKSKKQSQNPKLPSTVIKNSYSSYSYSSL